MSGSTIVAEDVTNMKAARPMPGMISYYFKCNESVTPNPSEPALISFYGDISNSSAIAEPGSGTHKPPSMKLRTIVRKDG
eukprot:SAG31_NODE_802_length_12008_cov_18.741036_6_plen_80_part_00